LLLPVLNWLEESKTLPRDVVLKSKIDVLSRTYLVDYATDIHKELHGAAVAVPEEWAKTREQLVQKLAEAQGKSKALIAVIKDSAQLKQLIETNSFTATILADKFQITSDDIESLVPLGKLQYECGKYDEAAAYLSAYRRLSSSSPEKLVTAAWGSLASNILMSNWEATKFDLNAVKDLIEETRVSPTALKQLQLRAWVANWALYYSFSSTQNAGYFLELLFGNEKYGRVLQTKSPYLLRHAAVAAIITKQRVKDVVKLVEVESYEYSDPVLEFLRALYVRFDYDAAKALIPQCEAVIKADYFLASSGDVFRSEFVRMAKLAIVESLCKIHSTLEITKVADMLGSTAEEAERFLVNLITENRLDAKIDSTKGHVTIAPQAQSVYQLLIEKTKTLNLRASVLAGNIERAKASQQRAAKD